MYSIYCTECPEKKCRILDVELNNDDYEGVIVHDKKYALTTVKHKGCPRKISIGFKRVDTNELVNPHKAILIELTESEEAV